MKRWGPHAVRVPSRIAWMFADQLVASASNFGFVAVAAHALRPRDFGVLTLTYTVIVFANQLLEAAIAEPLLVRATRGLTKDAPAAVATITLVIGTALGLGWVAVAWSTSDSSAMLLGTALCVPWLLVQNALRYAAVAADRAVLAFISDLTWIALQAPLAWLVLVDPSVSREAVLLAWAAPGAVSCLPLLVGLRCRISLSAAGTFARRAGDLSRAYVAESLVFALNIHGIYFIVGFVSDVTQAGALRAAQSLFGPLSVVYSLIRTVGIAELAKAERDRALLARRAILVSVAAVAMSGAYCGGLLLLPDQVGTFLFSSLWLSASVLVAPLAVRSIFVGAGTATVAALRAAELVRATVTARIGSALLSFVVVLASATLWGARGAAWGVAVAAAISWMWFEIVLRAPHAGRRTASDEHRRLAEAQS